MDHNYDGPNADDNGSPEKKAEYIKEALGFRQKNEEGEPKGRQEIRSNRAHENPGERVEVTSSRTWIIKRNLVF